jgi:hypothetical protein
VCYETSLSDKNVSYNVIKTKGTRIGRREKCHSQCKIRPYNDTIINLFKLIVQRIINISYFNTLFFSLLKQFII